MRNFNALIGHIPVTKLPFVLFIILFIFSISVLIGGVNNKTHYPPDISDHFEVACTHTPGTDKDDKDKSCKSYPDGIIDLIKLDEGFDDFETKYVYLKTEGDFICGDIFLNPKGGQDCYYDEKVPGPQCASGSCDSESCNLVDIGYWDFCDDFESCSRTDVPYYIGGHTITFFGYRTEGNYTYWYYKVESTTQPAISHLTFFLMCPDASLGDYVWHDENKDGIQGSGEAGINDVLVRLYDDNDQMIDQMYTMNYSSPVSRDGSYRNSNDGFYIFENLLPGDYYLTFEHDEEFCSCNWHMGSDPAMDSDILDDENIPTMAWTGDDMISLALGEHNMTIDGGLILIPLPVRFGDFTLELVRDQIELKWSTLSEINSVGFYIEKSTGDESDFQEIGFVESYGNSNELKAYSFTDVNLGRSNLVAYRIRQVDTDGNESFSAIRSIRLQALNDYEIYPNPTTGVISVVLPESVADKQIRVYNTIGQMLYSVNVSQATIYCQLDLSDLEEGIYMIHVDDGIQSRMKKVILSY